MHSMRRQGGKLAIKVGLLKSTSVSFSKIRAAGFLLLFSDGEAHVQNLAWKGSIRISFWVQQSHNGVFEAAYTILESFKNFWYHHTTSALGWNHMCCTYRTTSLKDFFVEVARVTDKRRASIEAIYLVSPEEDERVPVSRTFFTATRTWPLSTVLRAS